MGKVGRVSLPPLYDAVMKGGGEIDKKARWAVERRLKLLPNLAPRIIKPIGRAVGGTIYSDACATEGGVAAVTLFSIGENGLTVFLGGNAEPLPLEGTSGTE